MNSVQVLRAAFLALVLANLLLFAYGEGYFGAPSNGTEPQRLANQIEPQKIKLVAVGGVPPASAAPAPAPAPAPAQMCRLVTGLTRTDAQALAEQLRADIKNLEVKMRPAQAAASFWVYIPPAQSKDELAHKIGELKKLDVSEFQVIQSGAQRNAISLGVFASEQNAQARLAALQKKGIVTARVAQRAAADSEATLELHGPADQLANLQMPLAYSAASVGACTKAQ